jgi:hypothetical protein
MRMLPMILAAVGAVAASGLALRHRAHNRHQDEVEEHEAIPGQFTHPLHDTP